MREEGREVTDVAGVGMLLESSPRKELDVERGVECTVNLQLQLG